MNKLYDIILGWPGAVAFCIAVFVGVVMTPNENNRQKQCEAAGGKWVQTMKTYHECKMPKSGV